MSTKKPIDWELVRRDYRGGQLSNRMIAERHGCSEAGIRKRAKEENWQKDLTSQVRKEVRAELVRSTQCADGAHEPSISPPMTDEEIIKQAALTGAEVVRTHRNDIRTASRTCALLLEQLVEAARYREEITEDIEEETKHDKTAERRSRMKMAISLPRHAGTMLNLSAALKNLITLERNAYSLDDKADGSTYEEELEKLLGED